MPLLNKYLTADTAIKVLTSKSLRWSSPLIFNDAFDVQRDWVHLDEEEFVEATIAILFEYLDNGREPTNAAARHLLGIVRRQGDTFNRVVFAAFHRWVFQVAALEKLRGAEHELKQVWRNRVERMRILCLSDDPGISSMWATYADSNAGVVLRLESSDARDSIWLGAEPVIYTDAPPRLPPASVWVRTIMENGGAHDWDHYLREFQFVKQLQWQYEREYRVIAFQKAEEEGHFSEWRFFTEDVREIVLGPRIAWQHEATIRMLWRLGYSHASLRRARVDTTARTMVLDDAGEPDDTMAEIINSALTRIHDAISEQAIRSGDG
ncbi:MAG: DUF2971 domain-containing protein [Gemmatimonadaceae bacterium]|nr:DUF2971 domain-containing protein [Gemmatimonadaceae bacterium]